MKMVTLCKYQPGEDTPGFLLKGLHSLSTLQGREMNSSQISGHIAAHEYFEVTVLSHKFLQNFFLPER